MTCPCNIFCARAVLDSKDALSDHLASVGPNDVYAEYPIRLGLSDELHGALSVEVRLRARVGREWE